METFYTVSFSTYLIGQSSYLLTTNSKEKHWRITIQVKSIYSEKVPKFCKISTVDLSYVVPVKSTLDISHTFVAFWKYMNFSSFMLEKLWLSPINPNCSQLFVANLHRYWVPHMLGWLTEKIVCLIKKHLSSNSYIHQKGGQRIRWGKLHMHSQ